MEAAAGMASLEGAVTLKSRKIRAKKGSKSKAGNRHAAAAELKRACSTESRDRTEMQCSRALLRGRQRRRKMTTCPQICSARHRNPADQTHGECDRERRYVRGEGQTWPITERTSECKSRPWSCCARIFSENLSDNVVVKRSQMSDNLRTADPVLIIAHMPPSVWLTASNAATISVSTSAAP